MFRLKDFKVFTVHCSLFAGTPGTQLNWHGARIVPAVFSTLLTREGLAQADTVLFAGSSAGGLGVLVNLERVHSLLLRSVPPPGVALRAIVDSAWFVMLPNSAFAPQSKSRATLSGSPSSPRAHRRQPGISSSSSSRSSSRLSSSSALTHQYMLRSEAARTGTGARDGDGSSSSSASASSQLQQPANTAHLFSVSDAQAQARVHQEPELVAIELSDPSPSPSAAHSNQSASPLTLAVQAGAGGGGNQTTQTISLRSLLRQSRAARGAPLTRFRRWAVQRVPHTQTQRPRASATGTGTRSASASESECDNFSSCRHSLVQSLKIAYKCVRTLLSVLVISCILLTF